MTKRPRARLVPSVTVRSVVGVACRVITDAPRGVIILSPYLTSRTAESVIGPADAVTAEVLTTFDAETFATGGSSLRTLKELMRRGFKLRALDRLHAKVVVTETEVFVGSQNLTAAGTRNKEVTACFHDPAVANRLRKDLRPWIERSTPITEDMVADMEAQLPALRRFAADLRREAARMNAVVAEAERVRQSVSAAQEARRLIADGVSARRRTRATLRRALRRSELAHEVVVLTLRGLGREHDGQFAYWSLVADQGTDLTCWTFGENREVVTLEKRKRYLLIVPETGRLGWPTLNRTRLTKFGTGARRPDVPVSIDGVDCVPQIEFNEDKATLDRWNVRFSLGKPGGREGAQITGVFTLEGLAIVSTDAELNGRRAERSLALTLRDVVLRPFRYRQNSHGMPAETFSDGLGSKLILRLCRYQGVHFFSLKA